MASMHPPCHRTTATPSSRWAPAKKAPLATHIADTYRCSGHPNLPTPRFGARQDENRESSETAQGPPQSTVPPAQVLLPAQRVLPPGAINAPCGLGGRLGPQAVSSRVWMHLIHLMHHAWPAALLYVHKLAASTRLVHLCGVRGLGTAHSSMNTFYTWELCTACTVQVPCATRAPLFSTAVPAAAATSN